MIALPVNKRLVIKISLRRSMLLRDEQEQIRFLGNRFLRVRETCLAFQYASRVADGRHFTMTILWAEN